MRIFASRDSDTGGAADGISDQISEAPSTLLCSPRRFLCTPTARALRATEIPDERHLPTTRGSQAWEELGLDPHYLANV
ncbi:MAG: hypothetical protein P1V20_15030 [Verrucomicrobiales bacterium]|nr:hypothetical protein [Verrucomicrobiales bacterium]